MTSLELKIPPPIIAFLCTISAWLIARWTPELVCYFPARLPIAIFLFLVGITLDFSGLFAFHKAKTTVNPLSPDKSNAIVQGGPYRLTRNPMYLGMTIVLLGICVYFANPLTVLVVIAFIAYITRFQIIPEERVLHSKFGESYSHYVHSVRRWL